ncbi:MAG: hypothetical protein CMA31_03330 [Euryarchaeota archaeon]|nr:hypothetical protein [Euryarchaeota archaeon]|tara:strand:- start:273 stop:689 length:417 start_codon:yes stop_codon:yes gene_type:complete
MIIKKLFYQAIGFFCVGMAYIGFITPGIPFSIFLVIAAWAFAKSSPKMEKWLYNHPWFGEFLTNWTKKRVFPTKAKYGMIIVMASTLAVTYHITHNMNMLIWTGAFMASVAIWAWRYPPTVAEHDLRIKEGRRVAWLK